MREYEQIHSSSSQLEAEQVHLAQAEQDIADGQMRVTELELRIEALRMAGRDTQLSEQLLATLMENLAEWVRHRELVLQRIRHLQDSGTMYG